MTQTGETLDQYDRQTEFRHEERHLEVVVATIDATIQHKESREHVYAGHNLAADMVKDLLDVNLQEIRSTRDRPYFGRIDYSLGADEDVRTIYLGDFNVSHDDPRYLIASRNAPIARLYYRPVDGFFQVGNTRRAASVHLKRIITIEDARLTDFDDVLRLPATPGLLRSTSSRLLDEKLSTAGSRQLTDAVQTIQPEQYEQIASTQKPVLIVQGAAGSGKSLIGLHRIDFILSPFSNIGSLRHPTAERVIMFGPSPAFLKYVSDLLPGLGVHRVRQTTVSQWLLDQFSARVTLSRRDTIFDNLMNNRPARPTVAEIEAHQFKTGAEDEEIDRQLCESTSVGKYIHELVARHRHQHYRATDPGTSPVGLSTAVLKSHVLEAFRTHPEPNLARRYLVNTLAGEWARSNPRLGARQSEIVAEGSRLVESSLDSLWESSDFRVRICQIGIIARQDNHILEEGGRGLVQSRRNRQDCPL